MFTYQWLRIPLVAVFSSYLCVVLPLHLPYELPQMKTSKMTLHRAAIIVVAPDEFTIEQLHGVLPIKPKNISGIVLSMHIQGLLERVFSRMRGCFVYKRTSAGRRYMDEAIALVDLIAQAQTKEKGL
jgi:hypothetical protein